MEICDSYRNLVEDAQTLDDLPDSVQAWRRGLLKVHTEDEEFRRNTDGALRARERILGNVASPSHIGNFVLRHTHHKRLNGESLPYQEGPEAYEIGLTDSDEWAEAIRLAMQHPSTAAEFMIRDVTSNLPSRYSSIKAILSTDAYERRFGHNPSFVDLGCSRNLGAKKIATHHNFSPVVSEDAARADAFNAHTAKHLDVRLATGVDKWVQRDDSDHSWCYACTFPCYDQDPARMEEFDQLSGLEPENVDFHQANAAMGWQKFVEHTGIDDSHPKYDVVCAVTMMYQQSDAQISQLLELMKNLSHSNSLIVVQDFGQMDEDGNFRQITDNWYDRSDRPYRTSVLDRKHAEAGFVEWFRWSNGRCKDVEVTDHAASQMGV